MELKTRAVLIIPTVNVDEKKIEDVINTITIVRSCANCYKASWNADKTTVYCQSVGTQPPVWAIAMGCTNFDYLPFQENIT